MEIAQTPQLSTTGPAPVAVKPKISSDFDTFLRMLTAQMRNQDPLNPVESADFATQLATFSNVEQAVVTNDLLRSLSSQFGGAALADMAAWVGREARAVTPVFFDGNPITLFPDPAPQAQSGEIVVRDENGAEIQRMAVPANEEPLLWTGTAADGQPVANGVYQFSYVNLIDGQPADTTDVAVYSKVTEVRSEAGQVQLVMKGGIPVAASAVTALRAGS